ncbi:MAG: tetratricopeptide repeat protein [Magnetococcales bacterium]|nr:tetratricopeptide repeat protein [Magnetococcales bacterium]
MQAVVERASALFAEDRAGEALSLLGPHLGGPVVDPVLWHLAGACHLRLGDVAQGEACWREVLRIRPDFAELEFDLALLLMHLGRSDEAEGGLRRAAAMRPGVAAIRFELGNLRFARGDAAGAEAAWRETLRLEPEHALALNNLGVLLNRRAPVPEAEAAYRRALRARPDFVDAAWNLSLLLLATGRFAEGFCLYEFRYHPGRSERRTVPIEAPYPMWQGEEVSGKSFLVVAEQGYGDQMQFGRFVALLKARGAGRIVLLCTAPVAALLATLEGLDQVLVEEETCHFPQCDYWTFLLSLPHRQGITLETLPARLPYLRVPRGTAAVLDALPPGRLRVGLVWKGDVTNRASAHRFLPGLATLAPLWRVPGVAFVSLQKGAGEEEGRDPGPDQPLWHPELRDFAHTAAVVAQLDLVIAIDTAVVHLAGALQRPCWVLLPAEGCDWRWMHDPTTSPWYPGVVRLFRQEVAGDWSAVVDAVRCALARLVSGSVARLD